MYGGWNGHDPKGVAELFSEMLKEENFEVKMSDSLDAFLEDLTCYDLIVPIWTMGKLSNQAENNVCAAVAAGTGIAGCHGGMCDAFRENTTWQFMTGSQWVAHPGDGNVTYTVNVVDSKNPTIDGIKDFEVTSEKYYIHVDPAVNVLATTNFFSKEEPYGANGEITVPVVYTKLWGKGRVFYNSLGHTSEIFKNIPEAKELMRRGFLFATR